MDMLPSEYIKVSYFWPKSAKKSFCLLRVSKKLKKIEKNFEKILNFFFIKLIINIIHELCQHLGSLRSLWKAPETKTLGGGDVQSRVKEFITILFLSSFLTD